MGETTLTDAFKAQYPQFYGRVYSPRPPNYTKCAGRIAGVFGSEQCSRKPGHGPEGAWCKTHEPIAEKARYVAKVAKWDAEHTMRRALSDATAALEPALRRIAEGHNDPRELSREVIAALDAARAQPKEPK